MSSGKRLTIPPSKDVFFADDDMGAVVGEMSDDGDEAAAVGGNVFNRADVDDNDDNTRNLTQMTPRVVKKTPIAYQTSVKTGQFRTPNLNKDALHESIRLLISAIRQRRDIEENMCFSCPAGEKIFVPGNKYVPTSVRYRLRKTAALVCFRYTIGRFHMQANCGPFGKSGENFINPAILRIFSIFRYQSHNHIAVSADAVVEAGQGPTGGCSSADETRFEFRRVAAVLNGLNRNDRGNRPNAGMCVHTLPSRRRRRRRRRG